MQKTVTPRRLMVEAEHPRDRWRPNAPSEAPSSPASAIGATVEQIPLNGRSTSSDATIAEGSPGTTPQIVLHERNCHLDDRFRRHAAEKLSRVGKFDSKVIRVDVELSREPNPRLADVAFRVELTVSARGPVIRAEASAADASAALDLAYQKLQIRLRRSHQRRVNHTRRVGSSKTAVIDGDAGMILPDTLGAEMPAGSSSAMDGVPQDEDGPFLLREKTHQASPMSLDQALYEMELVGHDFFLFVDSSAGQPCVLYRRRGYSYGLVRLESPSID